MPGIRVKLPYLTAEEWQRLNDHKKKEEKNQLRLSINFMRINENLGNTFPLT